MKCDELEWNWVYYPYLDAPNKQEESALKAGYIKVVSKDDADKVIEKKDIVIDELVDVKKSAEQILQNLLDCGLIKEWYFNGKFNAILKADDPHLKIAELKAKLQEEREFGLNRAKSADHEIGKMCAEIAELKAENERLDDLAHAHNLELLQKENCIAELKEQIAELEAKIKELEEERRWRNIKDEQPQEGERVLMNGGFRIPDEMDDVADWAKEAARKIIPMPESVWAKIFKSTPRKGGQVK